MANTRALPGHPSMLSLGGGRWTCEECKLAGTLDELNAVACSAVKIGHLTSEDQLREWVAGRPSCPNSSGECCPDFSCCKPHLLASVEVREAYANGSENDRERWCMSFLDAFIATMPSKPKVHVTRGKPQEDEPR